MESEFDRIKRNLNGAYISTFQRRPNTCVVAVKLYKGRSYSGVGFSKAVYPDTFDPIFGAELAKDRALTDIAVQILMAENGKENSNE